MHHTTPFAFNPQSPWLVLSLCIAALYRLDDLCDILFLGLAHLRGKVCIRQVECHFQGTVGDFRFRHYSGYIFIRYNIFASWMIRLKSASLCCMATRFFSDELIAAISTLEQLNYLGRVLILPLGTAKSLAFHYWLAMRRLLFLVSVS